MSKTYEEMLHDSFCKYMQENHGKDWVDRYCPEEQENMLREFCSGAEWQKERAIEALSSVLDNWVHGGDADCVIAEFEEKMNETTKV